MPGAIRLELVAFWLVWAFPYVFRAPHHQKRQSITASRPTLIGLFFEVAGVAMAFSLHRLPSGSDIPHLGRQFRIRAGLYVDHELVRTGPYSIVRHPIYASVLAMLLLTMLLLTPWRWMPAPLAVFILGTEIRVRAEDRLLASRFGEEFHEYRRSVPAYIPFVR
jgi:protein-S-isoprenylcysteine O-methyltransferase Ste14